MLKKMLMAAALGLTLAAGAIFPGAAQARSRVYINSYLGGPIYPGMIIHGDPGWLPYPYYAYPISMFDEVYRIGIWRRSVRTNFRNGTVRRFHQPRRAMRISCGRARRMLLARGYRRVRAYDCKGRIYGFTAWRHGQRYRLRVSARTGGLMSPGRR